MPVAGNAAELPGVPLVRAADTEGTRDILSLFLHFLRKVNTYLLFLFKMDIFDIFLYDDEGNLLIIIIPGGSFLFITLVSRGTEIPWFANIYRVMTV